MRYRNRCLNDATFICCGPTEICPSSNILPRLVKSRIHDSCCCCRCWYQFYHEQWWVKWINSPIEDVDDHAGVRPVVSCRANVDERNAVVPCARTSLSTMINPRREPAVLVVFVGPNRTDYFRLQRYPASDATHAPRDRRSVLVRQTIKPFNRRVQPSFSNHIIFQSPITAKNPFALWFALEFSSPSSSVPNPCPMQCFRVTFFLNSIWF